jgi:hypothetical protein
MEPEQLPSGLSFHKAHPLIKVDSINHTVTGIITSETPDKTDEICDYDSSKPYYIEWSEGFAKATGGKSFGNVREMHALAAVGKLIQINFDDVNKIITGTAKIVDPLTWQKCEEGVLTAFSQGGDYVGSLIKEGKYNRYTANPSEVSVVDNPCNADATFEYIKADGTSEMRKFKKASTFSPTLGVENAETTPTGNLDFSTPPEIDPKKKGDKDKDMNREEVETLVRSVMAEELSKALKKKEDDAKKPYGDVEYADPGLRSDDMCRYPIDTDSHIRSAWSYINKEKNSAEYSSEDAEKIKDKIIAAWKDKIDPEGPPSAEDVNKAVLAIAQKAYHKAFPEVAKSNLIGSMTKADLSFDRRSELLNGALKHEYGLDGNGWQKFWAIETYESYVIVACEGGKLYRIDYVMDGDDAKLADGKTEVEVNYAPTDGVKKLATAKPRVVKMVKGMNTVQRLAGLLLDLAWLKWSVTEEEASEGDTESTLPKMLEANLSDTADTLVAMVSAEVSELKDMSMTGQSPYECDGGFYCAAPAGALTKANPLGLNQWTSADRKGELQVGNTEHGMRIGFGDRIKADIGSDDKDAIAKLEPGSSHDFKDGETAWKATCSGDGKSIYLSCSADGGAMTEGNVSHDAFMEKSSEATIIKSETGETFIKVAGELLLSAC